MSVLALEHRRISGCRHAPAIYEFLSGTFSHIEWAMISFIPYVSRRKLSLRLKDIAQSLNKMFHSAA